MVSIEILFKCILMTLILSACGGGSGGSTPSPAPIDPVDPPSPDPEPEPEPVDTIAPTAEILFPWEISHSTANTLRVKGIASDASGIVSIRVNGTPASLTEYSLQTKRLQAKTDGDEGESVEWEAQIDITSAAEFEITVEAEDGMGNIAFAADKALLVNQPVPSQFTIDHKNHRMIGRASFDDIVVYDLVNEDANILPIKGVDSYGKFAYVEHSNSLFYVEVFRNDLSLYSFSLDSGLTFELLHYDLALDPSLWSSVAVMHVDVAQQDEGRAYLLLKYFSSQDYSNNKAVLMQYDMASGEFTTIVDDHTDSLDVFSSDYFSYTEQGFVAFNGIFGTDDGLSRISLDGSTSDSVTPELGLVSTNIDVDMANDVAYVTGFSGIAAVDLSTGQSTQLSMDADQTEFNLTQPRSTGIDEINNRLLVADSDLDMVIAVDLTTGERSKFLKNGVGTGRALVAPRAFALDFVKNVAYVFDDGGNSPPVLLSIDLNTGNRIQVAHLGDLQNIQAQDIILDSVSQTLYLVSTEEIVAVDIASEKIEVLSGGGKGVGIAVGIFTGGSLDVENNRLLVTDAQQDLVLAVDLDSGDRSLVSSLAANIGAGPDLYTPVAIEFDARNNRAFVVDQQTASLLAVDLASGDRSLLLDSCMNSNGQEFLDPDQHTVQELYYNEEQERVLIVADTVLSYDLANDSCSPSGVGGVFDIAVTPKGQVLGSYFNQLVQLDLDSTERVIISK